MSPRAQSAPFTVEPAPGPSMDEAKRSFLRMVSHELRTPLNSVIGFSEIINRELHGPISDPRYKAHAGIIRDSGLKLLKLVKPGAGDRAPGRRRGGTRPAARVGQRRRQVGGSGGWRRRRRRAASRYARWRPKSCPW